MLRSTRLPGLGLGTRGSGRGGHGEGSWRGRGDGLHLAFLSGARSGCALMIRGCVDGHGGIDVQGRSGGDLDRQGSRRDAYRGGGGEGFDEVAQGDKDLAAILGILGEVVEEGLHLQPQGKESSSDCLELLEGVVRFVRVRETSEKHVDIAGVYEFIHDKGRNDREVGMGHNGVLNRL